MSMSNELEQPKMELNQSSITERGFTAQINEQVSAPVNRLDIDGLRGLAIIFVVGYNTFPAYFPGGFIGVPIFFVISGYLITLSILREYKLTNKFSFMNFYGRRIRRIIPPFLLMLTVNYLIYCYCKTPLELQQVTKDSIPTLFMIQNLRQNYNQATLPAVPPNSLTGLWTLGIQVQFYLIWPIVVLFLWKLNKHNYVLIGILLIAAFLYQIRYSFTLVGSNIIKVIIYSISQSWQILLGCAFAYYQAVFGNIVQKQFSPIQKQDMANAENSANLSCIKKWISKIKGIKGIIPIIGVALLILSQRTGDINANSFFAKLLVILSTTAVLYTRGGILSDYILGNSFMVFMGRISYPWSLIHYPVLFFCSFTTRYMQCLLGLYFAIFCMVSIDSKIRWNRSKYVVPGIGASLIGIYLLSKIIQKYPAYFMIPRIQM